MKNIFSILIFLYSYYSEKIRPGLIKVSTKLPKFLGLKQACLFSGIVMTSSLLIYFMIFFYQVDGGEATEEEKIEKFNIYPITSAGISTYLNVGLSMEHNSTYLIWIMGIT